MADTYVINPERREALFTMLLRADMEPAEANIVLDVAQHSVDEALSALTRTIQRLDNTRLEAQTVLISTQLLGAQCDAAVVAMVAEMVLQGHGVGSTGVPV